MKTATKFIVAALGLFLLSVVLILIGQRNNINAVIKSIRHNEQSIAEQVETKRLELNELLKEYMQEVPRDFTPEEQEKILSGELDPEDAVDLLISSDDSAENPDETISDALSDTDTGKETDINTGKNIDTDIVTNTGNKGIAKSPSSSMSGAGSKVSETAVPKAISDSVAKLYVYKAVYIAKLGRLEQGAIDEYLALSEKDRTPSAKRKIVFSKVSEAAALEKTCDGQVEDVLRSLGETLTAEKTDLSIIKKIQNIYQNEKSLKKAYYLNRLYS